MARGIPGAILAAPRPIRSESGSSCPGVGANGASAIPRKRSCSALALRNASATSSGATASAAAVRPLETSSPGIWAALMATSGASLASPLANPPTAPPILLSKPSSAGFGCCSWARRASRSKAGASLGETVGTCAGVPTLCSCSWARRASRSKGCVLISPRSPQSSSEVRAEGC